MDRVGTVLPSTVAPSLAGVSVAEAVLRPTRTVVLSPRPDRIVDDLPGAVRPPPLSSAAPPTSPCWPRGCPAAPRVDER